ncbi:unnamed protein product [Notodromas monacha]|uniref:Integrase catalytic domain-containing protein n=1 Tax=Notodromas monacha TaxID=399045 RepID=A0A7R9GJ52_9CRUS|nr:unnamed protein product [Notodromas monacha]CAG0924524.1 unnamed protein product [Notodromas monacha]
MNSDRTESEPQPGPSNANASPQPVASSQPRATANPWNFLMLNAIRTYAIANGIPNANEVPRDELIIALQARGATPLNIILSSPPDYQTGPGSTELLARSLLRRRVDYTHQSPNESIEMYLRRLETAFKHDGTPNFTKVNCLIGHSQPKVAEATQLLYDQGFEDYDVIAEKLKARFRLSPFEHFTRFQQFHPAPDELFSQFGPRLRNEYLRYLALPANEVGQHETAITRALIGQLLSITTGGLHAQLHARATADHEHTRQHQSRPQHRRRSHPPAARPKQRHPASPNTTAKIISGTFFIARPSAQCRKQAHEHPRRPQRLTGARYKAAPITQGAWSHIQLRNAGTTRPTRTYHSNMSWKREDRAVTAVLCSIPTPTDDSLTIIITIKNKRVTALINTGATKSFMATDVAEEVGLSPHPTKARISAAVLHVSTTVSHAVSTVFTLGLAAYEATFLLLSNAHYPVILGLNTLKNLPFCFTLDGQQVFSGFQQIKPINKAPKAPIGKGITFVHGTPTEQQQITALLRRYAPHIFQWRGKHGLFPQHIALLPTNGEDPEPSCRIRLSPDKRPAFQHIIDNYTRADVFAQLGSFEIIHSDGAAVFSSAAFKCFTKVNQMEVHIAQPYHPEGNGACERTIKSLTAILAKTAPSATTWDQVLYKATMAYNRTPHSTTGLSPLELWHKKPMPTPANIKFKAPPRDISDHLEAVQQTSQRRRDQYTQQANKRKLPQFHSGQMVMLRPWLKTTEKHAAHRRFLPKCYGPFRIIRYQGKGAYNDEDRPRFRLANKTDDKPDHQYNRHGTPDHADHPSNDENATDQSDSHNRDTQGAPAPRGSSSSHKRGSNHGARCQPDHLPRSPTGMLPSPVSSEELLLPESVAKPPSPQPQPDVMAARSAVGSSSPHLHPGHHHQPQKRKWTSSRQAPRLRNHSPGKPSAAQFITSKKVTELTCRL